MTEADRRATGSAPSIRATPLPPLLAIPFPAFDPVAVAVGPIVIRWYALAYIGGLVAGWLYARSIARSVLWGRPAPMTPTDLDDMLLWVTLGIIAGGRIGYVVFYNPGYFLQNPAEVLQLWQGGMAFHGGLLGAIVAMVLFAWKRGLPLLPLLDVAAAVAPIGLFLGRIANFINGELWGRVTDVSWGVVFPHGGPLARHPSQLYQAALEGLLLFAIVTIAIRMGSLKRPGLTAGIFGIGYGVARCLGELFREPDPQLGFLVGGLTMGMLLSVPMILAGLWLALRARRPA